MIRIEKLSKTYGFSGNTAPALHEVDLTVQTGEFVALHGTSGSGKSTLLNLISGIDRASAGKIFLDGHEISAMDETQLTLLRRDKIGFVFQFFNLLPTLSVLENVMLPAQLKAHSDHAAQTRALALLQTLGIHERFHALPDQFSGGQQQRVAIARALINDPPLLLADEPTGNLDTENGMRILTILRKLVKEEGKTVLLATHSVDAAHFADRLLQVRDGKIFPLAAKNAGSKGVLE